MYSQLGIVPSSVEIRNTLGKEVKKKLWDAPAVQREQSLSEEGDSGRRTARREGVTDLKSTEMSHMSDIQESLAPAPTWSHLETVPELPDHGTHTLTTGG